MALDAIQPQSAASQFYPRWVDLPGDPQPCPCVNVLPDAFGNREPPPLNCPRCRGFRVIKRQVLVSSPQHHSAVVGIEMGPDAEPVRPHAPSLEEVLSAGYDAEASANIVAREAHAEAMGYPPYGDTPIPILPVESRKPFVPEPVATEKAMEAEF